MIPAPLLARLRQGHRFLLTSHMNPDGDSVGSQLGMARVLAALGKSSTIWNLHAASEVYSPLPGFSSIHLGEQPPEGFPGRFDSAIVLECPGLDRTGIGDQISALPLLNIDHHLGNQCYGAVNWVDAGAPAVGVMVFELARALGIQIDAETADCLYLALVSDTGGFRFSNATPAAFDSASRLVAAGARVERVSHWLHERQPEAAVRLLGQMLATLERHHDGTVATVYLTREMFERTGAAGGDSEGLIDVPRSIAGVEAVALARELAPGEWKVSLRSRGAVDIEQVARARGGGGHRNAAGCKANGELDELLRTLAGELARAIEAAGVV